MVSLSDLDRLDNGSFDRMVRQIRKIAKDESVFEYLVCLKILEGLTRRAKKEQMGLPTFPLDFDHVPKKKRTGLVSKFPSVHLYTAEEQEVGAVVYKHENQGKNVGGSSKKRCCRGEEEEGGNKLKKKKKTNSDINFAELGLDPPPELPTELRKEIEKRGGNNLMLVIQKELFATDLNTHNARFSIPVSQITHPEFLTQKEKEKLKNKEGKNKEGLDATLIEPCLNERNLCLKEWPMKSSSNYMLISGWNSISQNEKNSLEEHDIVQLWSFRCDGKLWFLLHNVRPHSGVEVKNSSNGDMVLSPNSTITSEQD